MRPRVHPVLALVDPVLEIRLAVSAPAHGAELAAGIDAFCSKRFAEAFKILEPLAEKGDRDAQLIMGLRFFHGMDGKRPRTCPEVVREPARSRPRCG